MGLLERIEAERLRKQGEKPKQEPVNEYVRRAQERRLPVRVVTVAS